MKPHFNLLYCEVYTHQHMAVEGDARAAVPLVTFADVNFQYFESPSGVSDVSFRLHRGDRVLLIGHNGSGKSTLLSLVGGRRKAHSGTTTVLGSDAFEDTSLNARVSLIGIPWPPEAYFANTVDSIASPAPFPTRKADIAKRLHLPLTAQIDKMSSGEKRRVQILFGMLRPSEVYLLDECSTDIDVAERATVLQLIREECDDHDACCVYATHILDGVKDWATHVALVTDGRIVSYLPVSAINVSLDTYAHQFMAKKSCRPFESYLADMKIADGVSEAEVSFMAASQGTSFFNVGDSDGVVVRVRELTYKNIFSKLSFIVRKGSRTLLLGCNGSGKSTLLNMMGGKQFFNNADGALTILGRVCYDDMLLNGLVAYCGDWWTKPPGGEMHVFEMLPDCAKASSASAATLSTRGALLVKLLDIDLSWDVRHISAGEQKRVQLLLHMYADKPLVILDEATADLDVDQRHELLKFLYLESALRGVTVIYTTHIFEGLHGWASDCIVLDRTTRGVYATITDGKVDLGHITDLLVELKNKETF